VALQYKKAVPLRAAFFNGIIGSNGKVGGNNLK
jgi:hypothetical protein